MSKNKNQVKCECDKVDVHLFRSMGFRATNKYVRRKLLTTRSIICANYPILVNLSVRNSAIVFSPVRVSLCRLERIYSSFNFLAIYDFLHSTFLPNSSAVLFTHSMPFILYSHFFFSPPSHFSPA